MQVRKQQLELDMEPTDWLQIGKVVCQGCILSPCLFNLYAENILRNAGLEETQAGSRLPGESQGRWSLMGCRLWGCTESDD